MELPRFIFRKKKKKKKKKTNRLRGIATPDAGERLTAEDKFTTRVGYRMLDFFLEELEDRFEVADSFCELFSPVRKTSIHECLHCTPIFFVRFALLLHQQNEYSVNLTCVEVLAKSINEPETKFTGYRTQRGFDFGPHR
ncbi:hypothetical protein PR048_016713, partial [Dryococelus australis]